VITARCDRRTRAIELRGLFVSILEGVGVLQSIHDLEISAVPAEETIACCNPGASDWCGPCQASWKPGKKRVERIRAVKGEGKW